MPTFYSTQISLHDSHNFRHSRALWLLQYGQSRILFWPFPTQLWCYSWAVSNRKTPSITRGKSAVCLQILYMCQKFSLSVSSDSDRVCISNTPFSYSYCKSGTLKDTPNGVCIYTPINTSQPQCALEQAASSSLSTLDTVNRASQRHFTVTHYFISRGFASREAKPQETWKNPFPKH